MTNFDLDARIEAISAPRVNYGNGPGERYKCIKPTDLKALLRDFAEAITPEKRKDMPQDANRAWSYPSNTGHNVAIDQIQQNTKQILGE